MADSKNQGAMAGMLPHEKVAFLCKKYAKGPVCVISLDELAVGVLNRAISVKYVHSRLRLILEKEGFSIMRYKHCTAIEPSDADPLASTRRHQEVAANSSGMLAQVDDKPRNGLLTKNHLLLGLLALKDGRIAMDHNKETFWKVPPKEGGRHKELHQVLERGLNVLLLDKAIWTNESWDDIKLIIDVDNEDQISCLADHEIHMLNKIKSVTAEQEKVGNPSTLLWPRVYEQLKISAGTFSKKDCTSLYNCHMKLSDFYCDFLTNFHFHIVNPSALKVKPEIFGWVALLPDKMPWIKVALLCHCYLCHSDHYEEIGLIQYAGVIKKPQIEKFVEQKQIIGVAEEFLAHCFAGCQPMQKNPVVFKAMAKFAAVSGGLVYKGEKIAKNKPQKLGERTDKFAVAEHELWSDVGKYGVVCDAFLAETDTIAIGGKDVRKQETVKAVVGPPLRFNEDGVLHEDLAYKAGKDSIEVGAMVVVYKKITQNTFRREVQQGEEGKVIRIETSFVSVKFGSDPEIDLPRTSLRLKPEDTAPESLKKKQRVGVANPAQEVKAPVKPDIIKGLSLSGQKPV